MTVLDNAPRDQYTATGGQTVFPYTFEIAAAGDIKVLQNGTLLNQGAGAGEYAVSGVGVDTGGNVTLVTGATSGDIITIYRDMAYERLTAYTNAGDFLAADVNNDFDRLWLALQQNGGDLDRVLIAPNTDPTSIDMTIPEKATRLGKYLKFNDTTGNPEVGSIAGAFTAAGLNHYNFTGDGATVNFTLGMEPGGENNTQVYIDGVYQQKDGYNVSGAVVQFSVAPPNLSTIEVMVIEVLPVGATTASQVSFTQAGSTYGRNVQLKLQESVSVKDFGATGDGTTDDTAAIQAALDSGSKVVSFPEGNYKCGDVNIPANVTIDGANSLITLQGGATYIFRVSGDDVSIKGFDFNNVSQNCVQIGTAAGTEIKNTTISSCRFTGFEDYSTILLTAWPINLLVTDCIFDKGSAWDGVSDSACVRMGTEAGVTKTGTSIIISNNFMRGYKNLFRGGTTGYMENLVIADNQMQDCGNGLWTYHVTNSTVTGNTIQRAAQYAYIWRSYVCSNNSWWNSTDTTACVIIEVHNGSFTGNKIFNCTGTGLLLDGGGSQGVISNNDFETIGKSGIFVDPDHSYGGNVRNILISNNRVYDAQNNGIAINATGTNLDGASIIGNNVIAVGQAAATTYACVKISGDGNLNNVKVSENYFIKDDNTTAGGTSQVEWGIKLADTSASTNFFVASQNFMSVPTTVSRDGTGNSVYFTNNYVTETASLDALNADIVALNVDLGDTKMFSKALSFQTTLNNSIYRTTSTASAKVLSGRSDVGGANTETFQVLADGDVNNSTGVYGTISDQNVKQDIVDARNGYLDEIKQLQFKNYRLINDVAQNGDDAQRMFGLIAQDLEAIYPSLVETNEDGIKSIKTSVLLMIGLKALQELASKVEALETN